MKFNTKKQKQHIANHEGAKAWALSPELELYTAVVTASLSAQFYQKEVDRLERIRQLMQQVAPEFVAQLAVYCREQMHLRSIPVVLTVELARIGAPDGLLRQTAARIIQRADEITEMLAYYQLANSREGEKKLNKLSKQLQKGIAVAFNKFDEYQFAKYNRDTGVSLRDALFLTHPRPATTAQQELFDKIAKETLEVPYTWEVEMSRLGQQDFASEEEKQVAFALKWDELIMSGRLGYMAMLRNLRNFLQSGIRDEALIRVAMTLGDPAQVRKSKQLPVRFLAAWREVRHFGSGRAGILMESLESALRASAENIAGFDLNTRILLAADTSGSMCHPISPRSSVQYYDIGLMLSMLLHSRCQHVVTGIFGDYWKREQLPAKSILNNVENLRRLMGEVGYSTNAYLVIRDLIERKEVIDKVMIFTDMQLWDSHGDSHINEEWAYYKQQVAPEAKLYIFDLAGYGHAPLRMAQPDVFLIAGWSDKVFEVLAAIENGSDAIGVIKEIAL